MNFKKIIFNINSLQDSLTKDYSKNILYLYTRETIEYGSILQPPKLKNIELIIKDYLLLVVCDSTDFEGKVILMANSVFSQKRLMNLELPLLVKYKAYDDYNNFLKNDTWQSQPFDKAELSGNIYKSTNELKYM